MADDAKAVENPLEAARAARAAQKQKAYDDGVLELVAAMERLGIGISVRPLAEVGADGVTRHTAVWQFVPIA